MKDKNIFMNYLNDNLVRFNHLNETQFNKETTLLNKKYLHCLIKLFENMIREESIQIIDLWNNKLNEIASDLIIEVEEQNENDFDGIVVIDSNDKVNSYEKQGEAYRMFCKELKEQYNDCSKVIATYKNFKRIEKLLNITPL